MILEVLARLSRRSEGPTAASRRELVGEFCRATGWRDSKGRLSVSSANVALGKLERQGKVQLPAMLARAKGPVARGSGRAGLRRSGAARHQEQLNTQSQWNEPELMPSLASHFPGKDQGSAGALQIG